MVAKAGSLKLDSGGQAGADEVLRYFPDLEIPEGLTLADLEKAEDMVMDWCDGRELRAIVLVSKLFRHLEEARRATLSGKSLLDIELC